MDKVGSLLNISGFQVEVIDYESAAPSTKKFLQMRIGQFVEFSRGEKRVKGEIKTANGDFVWRVVGLAVK